MKSLVCVLVLCGSLLAQQPATPNGGEQKPKSGPTLTDKEKLQLREFQLKDSNLANQIGQLQQAQKANSEAFTQWAKDKCPKSGTQSYQIDFSTADCAAVPAGK
jgi:hypothetical protein